MPLLRHSLETVFALALAAHAAGSAGAPLRYPVVGTGQTACYDERREMAPPKPGEAFFGQDAQIRSRTPSYRMGADGLTVEDLVTGLVWQRSPDTDGDGALTRADKLTWDRARARPAALNAARFGGYADWRLPTIKELYSLILFSGLDPSGPEAERARLAPFIDTRYFKFAYGDPAQGERVIDSQYASSTVYAGPSVQNRGKIFGVNFADGRIKGYDRFMPNGSEKTFFVICVRGNPDYGRNDFRDNADGTVTDRATGLMWTRSDSGRGMNWRDALAWAQAKNAEKHLGHDDWRLPTVKELQSIVDYTRCPDKDGSGAIDPLFVCTPLRNEIGQADFGFYWSGTTHANAFGGAAACYAAFGRAAGWMSGSPGPGGDTGRGEPPRGGVPPARRAGSPPGRRAGAGSPDYRFVDVHGAGAQRSDPKTGDPAAFPHGRGPQGDTIHILNFVRLVRDAG